MAAIAFDALDGTRLTFPMPKGVNKWLVLKAVEKIHKGGDEAAVLFGLTRAETEVVAEVVARLEEHRPEAAP